MTAPPQQNGNGVPPGMNPPEVPGNIPNPPAQDTSQAISELIAAVTTFTRFAQMDDSAAEAKDWMQSALFAAQSMAIIDPNKTQTGTPLDHEIKMEQLRQQGGLHLKQIDAQAGIEKAKHQAEAAKASAQAPSPAKKVQVQRDSSGRMSGATVSGG
jgi:hypothetical protein